VIGYAGLVWIALAAVLAVLAKRPLLVTTALTAGCVWAADLVAMGLKPIVGRPRPFETITDVDPLLGGTLGSSFPSGHAATSFAGAVVLAYVFRRAALFVLLALAIAYSRVYLGVHRCSRGRSARGGRRARGGGVAQTSSADFSRPAATRSNAASRLIQIPMLRPIGE
jgi:hypothetical protein